MGLRVAVIGGGWAGLSAAVHACAEGHQVTLFEAGRQFGGRARSQTHTLPDGQSLLLDWGQHLLPLSSSCTLSLLRQVGVSPEEVLRSSPLTNRQGRAVLPLTGRSRPWQLLWSMLRSGTGSWRERWQMLGILHRWQRQGYECSPTTTVQGLCARVPDSWMTQFIRPLCLLLLNTPPEKANAQVFLHQLRDALTGPQTRLNLLIPTRNLQTLLPDAALPWLAQHQGPWRTGHRVRRLVRGMQDWQVDGESFDHVILACPASRAERLVRGAMQGVGPNLRQRLAHWSQTASLLRHEGAATVHVLAPGITLPQPLVRLDDGPGSPAQFVLDQGQLGGPAGLLAFVVRTCKHRREDLTALVLQQAREQLGLFGLEHVRTLVDRHATFSCHAGMSRPAMVVAKGLSAAGDYVNGPWPGTLEGAVRSGLMAALSVEGVKPPEPVTPGGPDAQDTASARTLSWDDVPSILPPAESS